MQFRKDLAGSLWVDGVQSSCFFRFVERLKRARKWVSGALRNHRPCLMNRFVIFYVSAREKIPPLFARERNHEISGRVNGAFYRGHYRKLDCFTSISAKLFQYNVRNNICRKKLSCNYWNILLTLFLLICFTYVFNAEIF